MRKVTPIVFACGFAGAMFLTCVPASGQDAAIPPRLTFADALQIAEASSPGFRAVRNLVDMARADVREARGRPNPVLAVEGEEYAVFAPERLSFWDGQSLIARIEQEIETAGRRNRRIRVAESGIAVAQSEVEDARRELHLAVGRAYFDLVLAQADRAIVIAVRDEIEQVLELTEARFNAGEVAGTEFRRLGIEYRHFVDQSFEGELAVSNARVALLEMLGAADIQQSFEAVDSLAGFSLRASDGRLIATASGVVTELEMLREEAAFLRPDLRVARYARERAEAEVKLQRAMRIPNVTAGWGYRRDMGEHAMDFAISIPFPFFGNQNPGGVQRADAALQQAIALETAAAATVNRDLQQAVNIVEISAQRVLYIEDYARNSQELRDIIRASYEVGEIALIDFLDVQREFLVTRQVRNRALYNLRIGLLELASAMGFPPAGGS